MQYIEEIYTKDISKSNVLIQRIFEFKYLLNTSSDVANEYMTLFVFLLQSSKKSQIIYLLSLLCNYNNDLSSTEKILELIYCNYQEIDIIHSDEERKLVNNHCFELLSYVKRSNFNGTHLIEAILLRLIFEQGSITQFINKKDSNDEIIEKPSSTSLDIKETSDSTMRESIKNNKTAMSDFSYSLQVIKSCFMEFYCSTSSKLKLQKIKDESLTVESWTYKMFFLKPFTFETKDFLVLLVQYIQNIPMNNTALFEYSSKFLIGVLVQLVNCFKSSLGKNTLIKCSFNHIFQSNKICYTLFDAIFKRSNNKKEFICGVTEQLKVITQTLISNHTKPFIYLVYLQQITQFASEKCVYLEHFNFNIDIEQKNSVFDMKSYECNIKQYAIMMRRLVESYCLPENFELEVVKFVNAIKSNSKLYLPELVQWSRETKKMTIIEMLIEIMDKLSVNNLNPITNVIWANDERKYTIMCAFDKLNPTVMKNKSKSNQSNMLIEDKCLCSVIYYKYLNDDKWKEENKILSLLIEEIEELKRMKEFTKKFGQKKESIDRLSTQTALSNTFIVLSKDETKEEILSFSNEFDLIDNKNNLSFIQCSNGENPTCYCFKSKEKDKDKNIKANKNQYVNEPKINAPYQDDLISQLFLGFYDITLPNIVFCLKRDLLLSTFALHFLNIYFEDEQFSRLKYTYNTDVANEFINDKSIYYHSTEMAYPTKVKNYSSCSLFTPRIFFKKDMKFYSNSLFSISHQYYTPEPVKNSIKTFCSLTSPKSIPDPLNSEYFKYCTIILNMYSEMIKNEYVVHGRLYLTSYFLLFYSSVNDPNNNIINGNIDYLFKSDTTDVIQKDKETIIILDQIEEVLIRRFLFMYQAIEVFMKNGKTYLFNLFQSERVLTNNSVTTGGNKGILNHLIVLKQQYNYTYKIVHDLKREVSELKLVQKWKKNELSTMTLLLLLNKYSGRSYNDLNQYPIMPWILLSYQEDTTKSQSQQLKTIDTLKVSKLNANANQNNSLNLTRIDSLAKDKTISDESIISLTESQNKNSDMIMFPHPKQIKPISLLKGMNYREMQYPISIQLPEKRDKVIIKYQNLQSQGIKFPIYFNLFYSTNGYVIFFLFRLNPFSNAQILFQSMKFDSPSRQFRSYSKILKTLFSNSDNRELIPEMFNSFEFCLNVNYNNYGIFISPNKLQLIHNLELPHNVCNPAQMVYLHYKSMNSPDIKERIHEWINNVFGYYQYKPNNPSRLNIFNKTCYSANNDFAAKRKKYIDKGASKQTIIDDVSCKVNLILSFGQVPEQILTDEVKAWDRNSNKKESKETDDFMFNWNQNMICKDTFNSFSYIVYVSLSSNKNFVYTLNKMFMKNNHYFELKIYWNIMEMSDIQKIVIHKMKLFKIRYGDKFLLRYQPKYSVFDTHDGTYFFTCRHYDNSIRIYTKDSEAIYLTNSFVMSLCRINDDEFLSGSKNGKLIHWAITYSTNNKEKNVQINKKRELFAHNTLISSINYIQKHNIIITTGDDHLLLIRKYYTFELLTKIKNNNNNDYFTDCLFTDSNYIYTMTLNSKLLIENKAKYFYITGYSLNGISFCKSRLDNYNCFCVNHNDIIIAGIYDLPSIALFSLEWSNSKSTDYADMLLRPYKLYFIDDFSWNHQFTSQMFFSNFCFTNEDNTFYVVLSKRIGRFSYDQQSRFNTLFK